MAFGALAAVLSEASFSPARQGLKDGDGVLQQDFDHSESGGEVGIEAGIVSGFISLCLWACGMRCFSGKHIPQ